MNNNNNKAFHTLLPTLTKLFVRPFKRGPSLAHHVHIEHLLRLHVLLKRLQRLRVAALRHAVVKGEHHSLFLLCRQSFAPCQLDQEPGRALDS